MNKQDRKQLEGIQERFLQLKEEIEAFRDCEQDKRDNIPENMQDGERVQMMDLNIENLDSIISDMENSESCFNELLN